MKKFYGTPNLLEKLEQGALPEMNKCNTCQARYVPNEEEEWIGCDGCFEWYHFRCQDLTEEPDTQLWYCKDCEADAQVN